MKLNTKLYILDSKIIIPVGREPVGTINLVTTNPRVGGRRRIRAFPTQRRSGCRLRKYDRSRACRTNGGTIKGPVRLLRIRRQRAETRRTTRQHNRRRPYVRYGTSKSFSQGRLNRTINGRRQQATNVTGFIHDMLNPTWRPRPQSEQGNRRSLWCREILR